MPGRRKVRDEEDAAALLEELTRTGEEFRAFCRDRGVDGRSLQCWRRNLGQESFSIRLLEVTASMRSTPTVYRLSVGDVTIEVDDGFRDDTLVRLLDVARRC